jgi:hypothetical protein
MPPAIIGALIAAATTVGVTAYDKASAPGAPKPPDPAEVTKQAINAETQNRATATKEAAQFLPGLQSNTSGGLSPDALRAFSADFSGNANIADSPQMKQLISQFLGIDQGATNTFGGSTGFGGGSNPNSPGLTG